MAKRKYTPKSNSAAKRAAVKTARAAVKKLPPWALVVLFVVFIALGVAGGVYLVKSGYFTKELSIHFLENGTKYTGDCTLVKTGNTEVLIDAGAKVASIPTLRAYIDRYCTDGVLEYVVITHAHEDHYAGFATNESTDSIFDIYDCRTVITFSQITSGKENQTMYKNYLRELAAEESAGATVLRANECAKRVFALENGVTMEVLDSKFYYEASTTENDHSVCTLFRQGEGEEQKAYLFTGDLEKAGEEALVTRNDLPQVELYKAGHHGSKTSSNEALLSVIRPKNVCVCCCAGSSEYTATAANQFPTQDFINRVAPYTDNVYVTTLCVDYGAGEFVSFNGTVVFCADRTGGVSLYCTNNTTKLKDSDWFKNNRVCPAAWG